MAFMLRILISLALSVNVLLGVVAETLGDWLASARVSNTLVIIPASFGPVLNTFGIIPVLISAWCAFAALIKGNVTAGLLSSAFFSVLFTDKVIPHIMIF